MASLARTRDEQRRQTPLQAFTIAAESLVADLAGASDLRTLEAADEITRRLFARHIAERWAEEFGERWAA
jgi:hypothetical protein